MQNLSYQLPKICCRCGETQATQVRRIYGSRSSVTGFYVVAMTRQTTSFAYHVPVCDDCSVILDKSDRRMKIGRIILSIVAAGLLYFSLASKDVFCSLTLAILTYVGLHFAYVKRPISSQTLGGFTGKYFWFSNREFFRQFAELNTKLVTPQDYDRLCSGNVNSVDVAGALTGFQWTTSNMILLAVLLISLLCIVVFVVVPFLSYIM